MTLDDVVAEAYDMILQNDIKWIINGASQRPLYEDVEALIKRMVELVEKTKESINVETAGVLVKRTDNKIDIYVKAGSL